MMMPSFGARNPRQLWKRYCVAVLLVLLVASLSHIAAIEAVSGGEDRIRRVTLSAGQTTLSQRILYHAGRHVDARGQDRAAAEMLALGIGLFERGHATLLGEVRAAGSAELHAIYLDGAPGGLDRSSRLFAGKARAVLEGPPAEAEAIWTRLQVMGTGPLLKDLETAALAFERAAWRGFASVRDIARLGLGLALLTVVLATAMVFLPAQRSITRSLDGLEEANARLAETSVAARTHLRAAVEARRDAEAAKAEALRAAEAKAHFMATVSHEIRTPMNGIIGMAELLSETRLEPRQRLFVDTVRRSGEALLAIVNDILDFSRLEAGRMELARAPFDLHETVEAVVTLAAPRAHARGVDLVIDYQNGLPTRFLGDGGRLRQVLLNLVGNAAKFTERGEIVLRVAGTVLETGTGADSRRGPRARLRIEVADTGIGIPPEMQERVFDAFTQARLRHGEQAEGTGLGLAIVRDLVAAMGGEIGLVSRPGEGSVFTVRLSLSVAADPAPGPAATVRDGAGRVVDSADDDTVQGAGHKVQHLAAPSAEARLPRPVPAEGDAPRRDAPPPLAERRILAVDDSRAVLAALRARISWLGAEVRTARTERMALEVLRREAASGKPPDVVLLDATLPGRGALRLGAEMRRIVPTARLYLMAPICAAGRSAAASEGSVFAGCIDKPVRRAALDALAEPPDGDPTREAGAGGLATGSEADNEGRNADGEGRDREAGEGEAGEDRLPGDGPAHGARDGVAARPTGPQPDRPGLRILVADDNRTNRLVLSRMLEGTSSAVILAKDGAEAVERFRDARPDIVLLDLSMPRMDGYEAAAAMQALAAERGLGPVPIVAVSANALPSDRARCLAAGMSGLVSKPVRKRELMEAIERFAAAAERA